MQKRKQEFRLSYYVENKEIKKKELYIIEYV